jgi:hypothetical protein
VQKAPGILNNYDKYCEYIMFTESDEVIAKIEGTDWLNKKTEKKNLTD